MRDPYEPVSPVDQWQAEKAQRAADTEQKVGGEVHRQALDNSLMNTDPVLVRTTIVGVVSAILAILVIGGYVTGDEKSAIEDQAGIIVPAVLILAQVIGGIWSRMAAYSPQSAAKIAVANAAAPAGAVPILDPPP